MLQNPIFRILDPTHVKYFEVHKSQQQLENKSMIINVAIT
jgi:hypothetical protein